MTIISASLAGCGNEGGLDYNFKSDYPVEYSEEPIVLSLDEMSGVISFDLLQGATINGTSANSAENTIFARNFLFTPLNENFVTPQVVVNLPSQPASPFTVSSEDNIMYIDTDAFAESLRMCDTTDVKGATNENGDPIGDGVRDYPQSITYDITYVLDNGFELEAGAVLPTRTIRMTINAISDPVTEVNASDISVALGGVQPMLSSTAPVYACNNNLTYAIEDSAIAEVDTDGNITGINTGETTITVSSVENPELSTTALVTVTSGFNLAITNQDYNDLGAPLGIKSVPTCTNIGIGVEPSINNDELTGAYTYTWTSDNANASFDEEESNGAFGATGRFANTLSVGETANLAVAYNTGYTGTTQGSEINGQTIAVTAEENLSCNPGVSEHPAGFNTDLKLDKVGAPYKEAWVSLASTQLSGGAILLTSQGEDKTVAHQEVWNKQRNWYSATFGLGGASVGKKYKFSVWVKLSQEVTDPITLTQSLTAWVYEGSPTGPGFDLRRSNAGIASAQLKPTTDWQLVELIDEASETSVWTVPSEWNIVTDVFQFWEVNGLSAGQSIILDEASIVEVE
ncbi:Ig-like domain-containing protein [Colwellia sp. 1_MG-2023]|uniref:Ig-like domain-containing protein n=1 Tax=unclassified Colwellia TaxID=196834 RepID=UPI001C083188|nr:MULTISPECIES: Ig-like domain-containing protein [unclassified Colwellia]MBU2924285.1 Ig-like domain-containing protein [Colwellia sp. C2M11]MDO6652994.1 Ig-like domain-containing protein [Colwellia sp. 3_MG-2023]MDO6665476.1 Ig-like domain-containing protein [Colwellia sp. 2_MG-2023]MDO6689765.1 Ig-like domain-containing protein [Colwellia sp. 1_MG-2023]